MLSLRHFLIGASALCIGLTASPQTGRSQSLTQDYEKFYSEFTGLAPDNAKSYELSNYVLERDAARFTLNGRMTFCTPVMGRVAAAVFTGNAKLEFSPSTEFERQQFRRNFPAESFTDNCKKIFFIFADSSYHEISAKAKASPAGGGNSDIIGEALSFISIPQYRYVPSQFVETFLSKEHNSLFYAHAVSDANGSVTFDIDPFDEEEVSFSRIEKPIVTRTIRRLISQSQTRQEVAENIKPWEESKDRFLIPQYNIDCSIDQDMLMRVKATMDISSERDGLNLLRFNFYHGLVLDSVLDENGKKLESYQSRDQKVVFSSEGFPVFYVRTPTPLAQGEQRKISVYYHGKPLERVGDWILMRTSIEWYPLHNGMAKSAFDLTYHTPANMNFFSIGEKLSSEKNGDVLTTHWGLNYPVRNVSFNLGFFKDYTMEKKDSLPAIRVHISDHGHSGITFGPGMEKELGEDVINSLKFFSYVYGKCPVSEIRATEIPEAHGEAFPGLLHLSYSTFDETSTEGFDEYFRAHEVSHQWWPMGVEYASHHDRWMSEGFASFSGLWYMQTVLKDSDKYFRFLNTYKENILQRPKKLPVWLGNRTGGENLDGRDYHTVIYEKGAWVMHMLRNMMIDLNTFNEDRFVNMMRDFYGSYRGKRASTDDFKQVVEKHMNMKMDWFFNQWVYGADIPTYTFSSTYQEMPDGKYKIHCTVKTEGVPENFAMFVPIKVDFGGEKFVRVRTVIKGNNSEFDLPLMPLKPKEITFNDLNSVLCEVED